MADWHGGPALTIHPRPERGTRAWFREETAKALARVIEDGTDPDFARGYLKLCGESATLDRLGVRPSIRPEDYPEDDSAGD